MNTASQQKAKDQVEEQYAADTRILDRLMGLRSSRSASHVASDATRSTSHEAATYRLQAGVHKRTYPYLVRTRYFERNETT